MEVLHTPARSSFNAIITELQPQWAR